MGLTVLVASACQEQAPTSVGLDIAAAPVTVELNLSWSEFGANLEVYGGYGAPVELGLGVLANDFAGTLNARTLVRFGTYPDSIVVRDSTGTSRTDTIISIRSGRVVAFFDTIASTNTGPVTLGLGALQTEWDARTVTWTSAVDTIDGRTPWPEPGAGAVVDFATAVWDPAAGDSVIFQLDSVEVAAWADPLDLSRGARLEVLTTGVRLRMTRALLRLDAHSSIVADTAVTVQVATREVTFVYDPLPPPPPDGMRIGGVPSWRTVLDVALPVQLNGPPEFCAVVGCPYTLRAGDISYAALVLTSRTTESAFQPTDSVALDVRPVLSRAALPKAPLGGSLLDDVFGRLVRAEAFGAQSGERIEIAVTPFARALVANDDGAGGIPPSTLALLSTFEPLSITFASFHGPGGPGEPRLRLILTIGPAVELP
jgi:hypothetical protein